MKICAAHWAELRKLLDDRGLTHLIPTTGEEAAKRVMADSFDPLMYANNAIFANALGAVGLVLLSPKEDGAERCPICHLIEHCVCQGADCPFRTYITHAADDALTEAKAEGLLASA